MFLAGSLVGCDSGGASDKKPTAEFSYSPSGPSVGESVTFTDESTHPADEELTERRWKFGDGGEPRTGASVTHTFSKAESYRVTLTVTDASGNSDSEGKTIQVSTPAQTYQNPVVTPVAADPSVIRAPDGTYYLYATQDAWGDGEGDHYMPMFRSDDLVDWTYIGDVFAGIPNWGSGYSDGQYLWAPDISKRNGTYYLYYSFVREDFSNPCIGLATADSPEGPWNDLGKPVFCSNEIGVPNSIDPYVWNEGSTPTMIWGSFNGIYAIELNEDGTAPVGEKTRLADDRFEGAYVHEQGDYKYLFLSAGTCCDGAQSTYKVYVGRSDSLTGPYVGPGGTDLRYGGGLRILSEGNGWVGPGHNSVATDDAGTDWLVYHAIPKNNPRLPNGANRRPVLIDSINWEGGWPKVNEGSPSDSPRPVPTIE
ncbi:MAG: family 43 glycosylhydrolase [Salinibacter sp.]